MARRKTELSAGSVAGAACHSGISIGCEIIEAAAHRCGVAAVGVRGATRNGAVGGVGLNGIYRSATDEGIRVIDVWESREAFEKFLAARIRPVAPEVGVSDAPKIQFFEVHNYFAGGRWRR